MTYLHFASLMAVGLSIATILVNDPLWSKTCMAWGIAFIAGALLALPL